ncbi:MAG: YceI family protein [Spirochaetota bacterium]
MKQILILLSLVFLFPFCLSAEEQALQAYSPQVTFSIGSRFGTTKGKFKKVRVENFQAAQGQAKIVIETKSIDTDNSSRDDHLRNEDFFDCKKYPTAVFLLQSLQKEKSYYNASGTLTLHGKTKKVSFRVRKTGKPEDTAGVYKGNFSLDRTEYGISYNSFINPIDKMVQMTVSLVVK